MDTHELEIIKLCYYWLHIWLFAFLSNACYNLEKENIKWVASLISNRQKNSKNQTEGN